MRIAFVVSGLATGGAEMMLYRLLKTACPHDVQPLVIALGRCGRPATLIEELGLNVVRLGLDRRFDLSFMRSAYAGYETVRRFEPDLLVGWMYHGNLAAWLFGRKLGAPVVWNIRQTLELAQEKRMTQRAIRAGAYVSATPKKIIYVSRHAREQHRALGYCDKNALVLPNGFDVDTFRRDLRERSIVRSKLGVDDHTCVIGHLARYHPMKDQLGLIGAARRVIAEEPSTFFALAGEGLNADNATITGGIRECGVGDHVRLLGETACPRALLSASDIFCLPSAWGEGFPNAVGEAMACELPCVVTRLGDAPDLVDQTGLVVEPGDRESLAQAILKLVRSCEFERRALGLRARARIEEKFSLPTVTAKYLSAFKEVVRGVDRE